MTITYNAITIPVNTGKKSKTNKVEQSKLSMLIDSWKTILISLGFSMLCGGIVGFLIWKGVWYIMNPHIMGLSMAKQTVFS